MQTPALSETEIRQRLAATARLPLENPYPPEILKGKMQRAAVLIPFLKKAGGWHLLFIRRTANFDDRHGGQVAYPGGRADPQDRDAEATACREASEEIGVKPPDIRVLGRLNDILTITNYRVTPVVGTIPWPYPFHPAPEEVDQIFTIPLDWLANPDNRRLERRSFPPPFDQEVSVIYFEVYDGELLWGASARITVNLLNALFPGRS